MSYATATDYEIYLEGFIDQMYGDQDEQANVDAFEADADRFYRRVNEVLKGISGIKDVPLGQVDGKYPESVIEWQCKMHICQRLLARKSLEWQNEFPDFFLQLKADARDLERAIMSGKIVFDDQTAEREYGINAPEAIGTITGKAVFVSDFQRYDTPYLNEEYEKEYRVKIVKVNTATTIEGAEFQWSADEGENWSENIVTARDWEPIEGEGAQVRWYHPRNWNGTDALFAMDDEWRFKCVPNNVIASPGRRSKQSFMRR